MASIQEIREVPPSSTDQWLHQKWRHGKGHCCRSSAQTVLAQSDWERRWTPHYDLHCLLHSHNFPVGEVPAWPHLPSSPKSQGQNPLTGSPLSCWKSPLPAWKAPPPEIKTEKNKFNSRFILKVNLDHIKYWRLQIKILKSLKFSTGQNRFVLHSWQ